LLKDGNWLWAGTPQGLARLDLQTLDCTLFEHTHADPKVSLAGVSALVRDPGGCLWAANFEGVARYCTDDLVGWRAVALDHSAFGLAFDADGNLWVYCLAYRGGLKLVRYEGHEPPAEGVWRDEYVHYPDTSPSDCNRWFSKSYLDWFQSPQECRALRAGGQWLSSLTLSAGLEFPVLLDPLTDWSSLTPFERWNHPTPFAADGQNLWFFARRSRPVAGPQEQYVLLHVTGQDVESDDALPVPWLFTLSATETVMVTDEARASVWIALPDGLIFSDGQTLQKMPLTPGDLIPLMPAVSDLVRDRDGRLWAVTDRGLFHFDEEADAWQPTEIRDKVLITPDDQGGLWAVSLAPAGFVHHLVASGDLNWRRHSAGPPGWRCLPRDVVADVGGGLWMTSPFCELHGFDGQQWAPYGGGSDIRGALLDRGPDGDVYAAWRDDRIQRYDGATWEILPAPDRHHYERVEDLAVDHRGGLWIAYRVAPYLRYLDGSEWRTFPDAVSGPIYALLVDAQGELWAGGERVLLHYDGANWERIPADDRIVTLADDRRGRIWASGPEGLYVYDPTGE
jgi:ligand-binding sensor domain-containing protein